MSVLLDLEGDEEEQQKHIRSAFDLHLLNVTDRLMCLFQAMYVRRTPSVFFILNLIHLPCRRAAKTRYVLFMSDIFILLLSAQLFFVTRTFVKVKKRDEEEFISNLERLFRRRRQSDSECHLGPRFSASLRVKLIFRLLLRDRSDFSRFCIRSRRNF